MHEAGGCGMRRTLLRISILTVSLVLVAQANAPSAWGAWGGTEDGSKHPMVGAIYAGFDEDGVITWDEPVCSGSYVGWSKDGEHQVFLTAAHCIAWTPSAGIDTLWVSFDDDPMEGDGIPDQLIEGERYAWDERFGHDQAFSYDFGCDLAPSRFRRGNPPGRPAARRLPGRPAGIRRGEGHGVRQRRVRRGPACWVTPDQEPSPCAVPAWNSTSDTLRRTSSSPAKALTRSWLYFNMNISATGLGGVCFGDSGSPQFRPGTWMIVSTGSGGDAVCRSQNFNYRLDTRWAREFLGRYLTLP